MGKSMMLLLGFGFIGAWGAVGIGALAWNWYFRWLFARRKR